LKESNGFVEELSNQLEAANVEKKQLADRLISYDERFFPLLCCPDSETHTSSALKKDLLIACHKKKKTAVSFKRRSTPLSLLASVSVSDSCPLLCTVAGEYDLKTA
jgi:hypothetical protein